MPSTYRNRTIHAYRDLIAQKGIRSVSSVHKAGIRSRNQMEVRAAGDRGGGFPPGAGAGLSYGTGVLVILDPWGARLRGDVGQDRVPWAGKQEGQ